MNLTNEDVKKRQKKTLINKQFKNNFVGPDIWRFPATSTKI